VTADGTVIQAATVVWATGSRPDFRWIRIDGLFDDDGEPLQDRGIARACRGLAFVGLDFQYSAASGALFGMGADAAFVVDALPGAERSAEPTPGVAART
jgi:putative flavoprotein involved in K+ transport